MAKEADRGDGAEIVKLSRSVPLPSGDVAWYSCHLDDCYSFKGKDSCLKDVFQTGVLEKRDGRWQHALMHGSYPVDKIPEGYVRRFYSGLFEKEKSK